MTTKLFQKQQFVLIHGIVATVTLMFCLTAFVGCGSNSGENVVFAQQPARANVERWEYRVVLPDVAGLSDVTEWAVRWQEQLNELGAEGWELVAVGIGQFFYLKRRLP